MRRRKKHVLISKRIRESGKRPQCQWRPRQRRGVLHAARCSRRSGNFFFFLNCLPFTKAPSTQMQDTAGQAKVNSPLRVRRGGEVCVWPGPVG